MPRRGTPRGTIAMILPIIFILFMLIILPPLFGSAEDAHPANETDHPTEVAGINDMFRGGSTILLGLLAVLGVGIIFVAFSTWRIRR